MLNGDVKMSPHETGDIHVESEGTAASERDQRMHQGRYGVCQSRRTPVSERAPDQALEKAYARRRGGGSGSRQPRPAQPGAKVQIYQALDGRVSLYYGETRLEHQAIPGGDSFMLPLG